MLAAIGCLLALPSVTLGPVLDDHGFRRRLVVEGRGPNATFCFGQPASDHFRNHGPWWSSPRPGEHCFLRPLSGLTHWLDFRLWPDAVWWMRLQTCLLYAALVALAAACYARLTGRGSSAGLAGLMFAVNEAHAQSLSMVAARNTLLSATLGLLALLAHDAYRTTAKPGRLVLAASAFALALLAGESGLAALGYIAAYALVVERGPAGVRARSLLPYLAISVLWALAYVAGGYGNADGEFYRDPRTDPLGTVAAGLLDLPVWLATLLGVGFATASLEAQPAFVRLASAAITLLLGALLWSTLRASRVARFHATGLLLSLLPLMLTVPQDRLLVLAAFGGFGLLACFLDAAASSLSQRAARWVLLAIHLGLAPLAFIPSYLLAGAIARAEDKVDRALPRDEAAAQTGVVIVRAPIAGSLPYALSKRRGHGSALPRYAYELYVAPFALEVSRIDATTLELAPRGGYCQSRAECLGSRLPFHVGQRIELAGMWVEVRELTARGAPRRVRFHFPSRLEDPSRRWLIWTARGIEPFTPPQVNEPLRLAPLSRLDAFR